MYKLKTIIWDSYKRNVKNLSFLTMVFSPLLILGIILVVFYFVNINSTDTVPETAVVTDDTDLIEHLTSFNHEFEVNDSISNRDAAEQAVIDGNIDSFFVLESQNDAIEGDFVSRIPNDPLYSTIVNRINMFEYYTSNNIEQIPSVDNDTQNIKENFVYVQDGRIVHDNMEESINTNKFINSTAVLLVFLFITNYSVIIGQEIAAEKGSKTMEVVLSSTSAQTHLVGKLSSIILMCLTQLGIYAVIGIIGFLFMQNNNALQVALSGLEFDSLTFQILGINTIYFVLSISSFTLLAAILASLVNKAEDSAKALQPLTLLGLGGFYLGIILAQNNPTHILVKISSYIPLFSNFTMPFRFSSNTVSLTGIIVSIIIYLIALTILYLLSVKIYKNNILMIENRGGILQKLVLSIQNTFSKKFPVLVKK